LRAFESKPVGSKGLHEKHQRRKPSAMLPSIKQAQIDLEAKVDK
jgi:hypothetical protein